MELLVSALAPSLISSDLASQAVDRYAKPQL